MKKFPYILLASAVLLLGAGCFSKKAPASPPAAGQPNNAAGAEVVWPAVPPPLKQQPDGKTATPPPPPVTQTPDGKTATPPPVSPTK